MRWRYAPLATLAILAMAGAVVGAQRTEALPGAAIVATLDGKPITAEELDAYVLTHDARTAQRLQQQQDELRDRMLDALIGERLLMVEAARHQLTVDEFVATRIAAPPATEEEIARAYQQGAARQPLAVPLDAARPVIKAHLDGQKRDEAKRRFVAELRRSARGRVNVLVARDRHPMPVTTSDPVKGSPRATVTLAVFSDFQCPYCRQLQPLIAVLLERYAGDLRVVWKDAPSPIHRHAAAAAEAARCAHDQNRFWAYHDVLFENQNDLAPDSLRRYATAVALDRAAFDTCVDTGKFRGQIAAAIQDVRSYRINATPTVFVNGRRVEGIRPIAEYERIIQQELEAPWGQGPQAVAGPQPVASVQPQPAATTLPSLLAGTSVEIVRRDGTHVSGRLVRGDTNGVRIDTATSTVDVPATAIQQVAVAKSSRPRRARRGLVIGGIAGAVAGAATTRSSRPAWMLMLGAGWGGIGALIGGLSGGSDRTVVYQAPPAA